MFKWQFQGKITTLNIVIIIMKWLIYKKAARLALGFYVTAFSASKGSFIMVRTHRL